MIRSSVGKIIQRRCKNERVSGAIGSEYVKYEGEKELVK
jgi:hypothetical protein